MPMNLENRFDRW